VSLTSSNYVIEARNLTKSYGRGQVLKGIDLQVELGTMVALLGPNGAGKTRIVRILSTLLSFDGATVRVDGHNVRTEALAEARGPSKPSRMSVVSLSWRSTPSAVARPWW
jgi:ABC-2 type transport system ATP-binding protein